MLFGGQRTETIQTRKYTPYPEWVKVAMILRYVWIVIGGVAYANGDSVWIWASALLAFLFTGKIVYWIYRVQDPVTAEIVFNNEEDGYDAGSDGDGDGDGGD